MSVKQTISEKGFYMQRQLFSREETDELKAQMASYVAENELGVVTEEDSQTIRGVHGPHLYDEYFENFTKDQRLLGIAQQLLDVPFYVQQFKINIKARMCGQSWPWHQDFVYWKNGDGINRPDMINLALLLSDVTMLNGPLCFIPKSHKYGDATQKIPSDADWQQDVSKNLTYQINAQMVGEMMSGVEVEYATGKAGDVLIFDPLVAHCSGSNLSPHNREMLILTYNPIDNLPTKPETLMRPEFLCSRDYTPLAV